MPIKTPTFHLFVYGTLMRGHLRADTLRYERYIGEVQTLPQYALLDCGNYPGLVRVENDGKSIHGELYEVNSRLIEVLDRIEGSPELFRLEKVEIENSPDVYAYFLKYKINNPRYCQNNKWEGI